MWARIYFPAANTHECITSPPESCPRWAYHSFLNRCHHSLGSLWLTLFSLYRFGPSEVEWRDTDRAIRRQRDYLDQRVIAEIHRLHQVKRQHGIQEQADYLRRGCSYREPDRDLALNRGDKPEQEHHNRFVSGVNGIRVGAEESQHPSRCLHHQREHRCLLQ